MITYWIEQERAHDQQEAHNFIHLLNNRYMGLPGGSVVKNPPANVKAMGLIPDSRGSYVPRSN